MRLSRHTTYKSLFETLPLPLSGKILGISGLKYWIGSKNYKPPREIISQNAEIVQADFPEVDICSLPYPDNSFDWVICDCVLEHVEGDIQKAVQEIYRVLKKNGSVIVTSAFMYPVHWGPKDLWRFHPDALRYLCRNFAEITHVGSWGNRWTQLLFLLYENARDWQVSEKKLSLTRFLATSNDEKYPIMVWIVAKK